MDKEFDEWNTVKKALHQERPHEVHFHNRISGNKRKRKNPSEEGF
jgi:hypothetical protein